MDPEERIVLLRLAMDQACRKAVDEALDQFIAGRQTIGIFDIAAGSESIAMIIAVLHPAPIAAIRQAVVRAATAAGEMNLKLAPAGGDS